VTGDSVCGDTVFSVGSRHPDESHNHPTPPLFGRCEPEGEWKRGKKPQKGQFELKMHILSGFTTIRTIMSSLKVIFWSKSMPKSSSERVSARSKRHHTPLKVHPPPNAVDVQKALVTAVTSTVTTLERRTAYCTRVVSTTTPPHPSPKIKKHVLVNTRQQQHTIG
jgi:hypothetical protein